MSFTLKKITAALVTFLAATSIYAAPHIVVFGDSLSDAGMNQPQQDSGNNTWVPSEGRIGTPITSLDNTTQTHPLWSNWFVAKKIPGETLIPWRVANAQHLDPATHSISYAFASAESGAHYLNDLDQSTTPQNVDAACAMPGVIADKQLACVPGVLKQIDLYLAAVPHPAADTTFIIWAGGNDIFNNISRLIDLIPKKKTANAPDSAFNTTLTAALTTTPAPKFHAKFPAISFPLLNLLRAKDRLISAGVSPEKIYFINMPDLAKAPAGVRLAKGNKVITGIIHGLTITFNTGLEQILVHNPFNKHNLPSSHIISAYAMLDEIFTDPDYFGVTHLSNNCVKDGKTPLCNGYVFYDGKHPTVPTGKVMAKWVDSAITN